jgi:hypothetical protein
MFDEPFAAVFALLSQISNEVRVFNFAFSIRLVRRTAKVIPIKMRERPCPHSQFMYQGRADGNLNALNGIHHHETQLAVKPVPFPDVIERSVREKCAG